MEIKYSLHKPNQLQVFNDKARFVVLVAGRRFGKTTLALVKLITTAFSKENTRSWYISPSYRQSEMIAWKMLQDMIPLEVIVKKDETRLEMTLIGNREIALKGADNYDSLRGAGLHMAILDEFALMKPNVWQEIIRPMLTDSKGSALFIGTPQGKNALWELWLKGQRQEDGFSSYKFRTVDNPFIDPEEVEDAKKHLNERYFRQEYEASFEDYTGLVWPEFEQKIHAIEPLYIPLVYKRIAAIDPAIYGTTGVLKGAVDEDGSLIIYSEFYEMNKRASEVCESMKEENIKWYIDPSSMAHTIQKEGKMFSLYDEYSDFGLRPEAAEHDVDSGINRVAEYFKNNKIKIFKTCKNLIYELERYHWSEERESIFGILKPKPYKKDDHLCDCLRYLVMSRTDKADMNDTENLNPDSAWGRYVLAQKKKDDFVYQR